MRYLAEIMAKSRSLVVGCVVLGLFGACTPPPVQTGINDPYEARNRKNHAVNKALDKAVIRPVAVAYGKSVPRPIRKGVSNFSSNLSLPGTVVNNILQLRVEEAGANTFRFLVNSTFGMAGFLDVATEAGIAEDPSDFGETLYVWGAKEGAYLQVPLVGPSTSRALTGKVVDFALNPLIVLDSQDRAGVTVAGILAGVDARYEYREVIDSVLYDSADSYAQTRLLYLQNRRFQLSGETQLDASDPYEDVYGTE